MSTMYGADVAQLRTLAAQFDRRAQELDAGRMTVGNAIRISAWVGPFAADFRVQWDSEHSRRVHDAASRLRDAAQKLRANADEQERASAADGSGTRVSPAPAPRPSDGGVVPGYSGTTRPADPKPNPEAHVGDTAPGVTEPLSAGRVGYVKAIGAPDDHIDGMGAYAGECTSWVAWRRKELGLPWRPNDHSGTGNGFEMAGRMGGTTTTPPSLGAIVSSGSTSPGHVMIIEEIYRDGSFRVSEMNVVPPGSKSYQPVLGTVRTDRVWHPNADGTYTFNGNAEYKRTTQRLVIAP
ncbi:CHAP domain-containing protein [Microbacterium suwonense]|uniref:Peptidase C51 domain-containing protein n=1 Tax=Microbacterium suwonense TaxID=683047 RepID=A0ABM8FVC9_9MICO|nr:CHAP domain-containing protein [Microbacterium suwonense]BDZ39625.1 hypothetical protein GCM10025863_22390 [Microbacterium suwonense]